MQRPKSLEEALWLGKEREEKDQQQHQEGWTQPQGHPWKTCRRLQRLLGRLWQELRGGGGGPGPSASSSPAARPPGEDDAYLYILLIMIFYGCLAGGLILAYTRSRKLESKHDPYHLYIERDWAAGGGGPAGKGVPASPGEPFLGLRG
uniref:Potassium voltage-gated channel subfamily E regulatory subunit 5 n=1 Tax=Laticauda laticaudata TaxID=8630 RepID=A0A8C5RDD1_LATLA